MEIKFSIIGLFIAILIILFNLFVVFVYRENLKFKYRKIQIFTSYKPIAYLKSKFPNLNFEENDNPFKTYFSKDKEIIYIQNEIFSNTLYSWINIVFRFNLMSICNKKDERKEKIIFPIQIFTILISLVLLIINLWVIGLGFLGIYLLIMLIDWIISHKKYRDASVKTRMFFEKEIVITDIKNVDKYLKYKKVYFLYKHLAVIVIPIIWLAKKFKNWGK